jgi:hypothetical protein
VSAHVPRGHDEGVEHSVEVFGSDRALLADRQSDRFWLVDPGFALDPTGRRWAVETAASEFGNPVTTLLWKEAGDATWQTHDYVGTLLYSERAIGVLHRRHRLEVSTDRGHTWSRHPIGSPQSFGAARWLDTWDMQWHVTRSGVLLGIVNPHQDPEQPEFPTFLVRSTNASWSAFRRVGRVPIVYGFAYGVIGDTLWGCDAVTPRALPDPPRFPACHYSKDLGVTWHTTMIPSL